LDNTTPTVSSALAADIARQLAETNPIAKSQLEQVINRLGAQKAMELLEETMKVEAEGGMMTADQTRRRTAGGIYLYLAKSHLSPEDRRIIWPPHLRPPDALKKPKTPIMPAITWEERLSLTPEILKRKGEAFTVKITLIGRPGRVIEKGEVVLTSMQSQKVPALPKGLPIPPTEPTTYVVYITRKQWSKVKEALKNPQDVLIVEGYPMFDSRLKAMAVFALNTTTKFIQQSVREAQRNKTSTPTG
jgi:hypothetical protein